MGDYPDEAELEKLRTWEAEDLDGLIGFLVDGHWWLPEWGIREGEKKGEWFVSTGGWSGNEERIEAIQQNMEWWMLNWHSTRRGGHFIFQNTNDYVHGVLEGGDDE